MSLSFVFAQEQASRFNNVFCLYFVPFQVSRVSFCSDADSLTVNDQLAVFNISFDSTVELAVHSVILQHVSQVIYRAKVVDTYDLNIVSLHCSAEYETSDTSESINTYFNHFV